MTIHNAIIKSTMLGIEDHGILTSFITVEWEGGVQGFGGYNLKDPNSLRYWIGTIIDIFGCNWEELPGHHCRINREDGLIKSIGHIIEQNWMRPGDDIGR